MQFFSKAGRSHILNIDADMATGKRRIYAIIQFASHLKKCVNFFDADAATGNGKIKKNLIRKNQVEPPRDYYKA
jgi:hypothetical protein